MTDRWEAGQLAAELLGTFGPKELFIVLCWRKFPLFCVSALQEVRMVVVL